MRKSQYVKPEMTTLYMEVSSILCGSGDSGEKPQAVSNEADINVQSSKIQDIAVSSPWEEAI